MADKVKFYTDEHIANAVAHGLRQRGVDLVTAAEAGMLAASDEDQIAWATTQGRVLVTHDRHDYRTCWPRFRSPADVHGGHDRAVNANSPGQGTCGNGRSR